MLTLQRESTEHGAARAQTAEHVRLAEDACGEQRWKLWGPYLSERQWGTVREDYSPFGSAWDYFPHDHARSRAYRWGEDGIAGISDDSQRLCLALALWNGKDQILKERLFGLTNGEGNHGEDVKDLYYYLDAAPTHSYLKMLYKYPQAAFPYADLVEENRRRGIGRPEYELVDTGVFDSGRYFDVFIEYAQAEPGDVLLAITAHNRGPEAATLHVLPCTGNLHTSAIELALRGGAAGSPAHAHGHGHAQAPGPAGRPPPGGPVPAVRSPDADGPAPHGSGRPVMLPRRSTWRPVSTISTTRFSPAARAARCSWLASRPGG